MHTHLFPCIIECLKLGLGFDKREEHRELWTAKLLEESTEDVIVVEEVFAALVLEVRKRHLHLLEHRIEFHHELGTGFWGLYQRNALDDL